MAKHQGFGWTRSSRASRAELRARSPRSRSDGYARFQKAAAVVTAVAFTALTIGAVPGAAPTARAAAPSGSQRVAVFVVPKSKGVADDARVVQGLMRGELTKLLGVSVSYAAGEPPTDVAALVGPSVESGFRSLNDRNPSQAEEAFERAQKSLAQYGGRIPKRLWARVLKGLGASMIMNGQLGEGQEYIDTCMNLWGGQQLSDYGWTLDLRTAVNDLIDRRANQSPGSIDVDVEPAGAAVRVDGELKGIAPVEVKELTAGKHWVETTLDGYKWNAMFVEVPSGGSAVHAVSLDALPTKGALDAALAAVQKGIGKGNVTAAMGDLRRAAGVDVVAVFEMSQGGGGYLFNGYVADGSGEPVRATRTIAQDAKFAASMRTFLATLLKTQVGPDDSELPLDGPPQASVMGGGDIVIDPNDPIFKGGKSTEEDPVTSKWWFWTIIGGVTAGLVAGGVVLFSSTGGSTTPSGTIVIGTNRIH